MARVNLDIDWTELKEAANEEMLEAFEIIAADLQKNDIEGALKVCGHMLGKRYRYTRDPEETRLECLKKLFLEWYADPTKRREPFWEWSHGRRHIP